MTDPLIKLAIEVAITTPIRFSKVGHHTIVRRDLVKRIRAELERRGVDWKREARILRDWRRAQKAPQVTVP